MTIALPRERWTARRWAAIVAGTFCIARREVPLGRPTGAPLTTL